MCTLTAICVLALAHPTLAAETSEVRFVILVPDAGDELPSQVFLASSADGWKANGRVLESVAPGVYSLTVHLQAKTRLEYKFTRDGTWQTVEKAADGSEMPNRALLIADELERQVVICIVDRWADRPAPPGYRVTVSGKAARDAPPAARPQIPSTLSGDIRTHTGFYSPQLKNQRTITVYLPPGYEDHRDERYPVLYMHDGNNVFDARTSFLGVEWRADETAEELIKAGRIEKLIIVGIDNNADRMHEYTPWRDERREGGGKGDAYLAFIVQTVKPFIDQTYRTRPGREDTAIAGSSLGGLISLYAACRYPEVFSKAGVISPALAWGERAVFDFVRQTKPQVPLRIWIDMGTDEGVLSPRSDTSEPVRLCREMVEIFRSQAEAARLSYRYEEVLDGKHHESDWAERFDEVLVYLFGKE